MEDPTSGTTHDLLLALAGRVDDDLLRWARELVALGEDARAVEMLTASLVAAKAVLPPHVRSALVTAAHTARTDLGPAAALPPPEPEDGTEHRFAAPAGDDPVAGAVLDFPARPLTGCTVLLARRLTPAGTAPGPLPHPVVLVRVHDRTRRADVLTYQLAAALERAGAPASVEVLPADGPIPAYHAAALEVAVELRDDVTDERPWRPEPAPRPQPAPPPERHALAQPTELPPRRRAPEPHPLAAPSPTPRLAEETDRAGDLEHRVVEGTVEDTPAEDRAAEDRAVEDRAAEDSAVEDRAAEDSAAATARLRPAERELSTEPAHRLDAPRERYADDRDERDEPAEEADDARRDVPEEARAEPAVDADEPFPEPPSPHPLAAPRPVPVDDGRRPARPTPLRARNERPRPTVTPISRSAPKPIPLVKRNGPNPVPRPLPVGESRPPLRRVDDERDGFAPPQDERPEPVRDAPERRETPALESLADPLNGPLHQPLLAPLLDPTRPEDGPLGRADDGRADDGRADDGQADDGQADDGQADDGQADNGQADNGQAEDRRPDDRGSDDAVDGPAARQFDDEWSQEWLSGTWAMAPSALDEPAGGREEERAEDEPDRSPRPAPRPPARHRFSDADRERSDEAEEPAAPDAGRDETGMRSDSIARLSDADRQLLARLQAELLEGRRQRIGRRITNGVPTNGSHRGVPPDDYSA